jgi:hypothetical protein
VPGAVVGIALQAAADDRDIRVGPQPGRLDAQAQLGAVDPAALAAQLPDRWDLIGGAISLCGMALIAFGPRGK